MHEFLFIYTVLALRGVSNEGKSKGERGFL